MNFGNSSFVALVSVLAVLATIGLIGSSLNFSRDVSLSESSRDERAVENSYFDTLAAKDAAKSHDSHHHSHHGAKSSKSHNLNVHSSKPISFRKQFAHEQHQLLKAKAKMHKMEEKDRVQAEKQTFKMERMSAHEQAREYEHHLERLANSVLPSHVASMDDPADAVRSALVDDLKSSKPALSQLRSKAHHTIAHVKAAQTKNTPVSTHAGPTPIAPHTVAPAASGSIMDTVRQAGEALEKRASAALFSTAPSKTPNAARRASSTAHLTHSSAATASAQKGK